MRVDDDRRFGILGVHPLDVCADRPHVHVPPGDDDAVTIGDTHHDALLVRVDVWRFVFGLVDIETDFLDESRP